MLPRLEKSACGCSLYTGSLVLAWLGFLGSMFALLAILIAGIGVLGLEDSINAAPTEAPPTDAEIKQREAAIMIAKIAYGVVLAILIGAILINLCLLLGVYKRNHCLMMPYLILGGISICFNALGVLIYFVMCFIYPVTILSFIFKLVGTVISAYFWLIIYNYWREVKEEELSSRQQQTTFNKL